jgi:hypothetical protein
VWGCADTRKELFIARTSFSGPVFSENGFEGPSLTTTGNITADSGTAPVAGGAAAFLATSTAGFGIYLGSGAPTVAAAKGSLYLRTDGSSTSTRLYVSDGSTNWIAVTTAS